MVGIVVVEAAMPYASFKRQIGPGVLIQIKPGGVFLPQGLSSMLF